MRKYAVEAVWRFGNAVIDMCDTEKEAEEKAERYTKDYAGVDAYRVVTEEIPEDPDARFVKAIERLTKEGCCIDDEGRRCIHICWGDWKHDHLRADDVMKLYGFEKIGAEIDDEDGGDAYSAWRYYKEV